MEAEIKKENIKKYQKLMESFFKIVNHYTVIEKNPKKYGTEEILHKLEIHTIHAIGENPGINVTELASWHGITKSAVSQVVKKVEDKDMIKRYKAPDNAKEVLFRLTEKGKQAYRGHKDYHKKIDTELIEEVAEIPDEKYEFLLDFFEIMADYIKSHAEKRR